LPFAAPERQILVVGDNRAVPMFEAIRRQFPNKKIRYVINTHHHFDHAGGLRDAVAEGTAILTHRDNQTFYERILSNRHTISRIGWRRWLGPRSRRCRLSSISGY
jgi:glyoxylase-like metal-dependent hydrolase (beta-lactamase superfamily II)